MHVFTDADQARAFANSAVGPVSTLIMHPYRMPLRITWHHGLHGMRLYPIRSNEWSEGQTL